MVGGNSVFVPLQLCADQVVDAHLTTRMDDASLTVTNADMRDLSCVVFEKGHIILTDLVQGDFFTAFELL